MSDLPRCASPAWWAVTYKPDGEHDREVHYCGPHRDLMVRALQRHQQEYTAVKLAEPAACFAWDL